MWKHDGTDRGPDAGGAEDGDPADPHSVRRLIAAWAEGTYLERYNAALMPLLAYHPLVIWTGLYPVIRSRMLLVVHGNAGVFGWWLSKLGCKAYHAEWASQGEIRHGWAASWLSEDADREGLLFANREWYYDTAFRHGEFGRRFLARFLIADGGQVPRIRIPREREIGLVREMIPSVPAASDGMSPAFRRSHATTLGREYQIVLPNHLRRLARGIEALSAGDPRRSALGGRVGTYLTRRVYRCQARLRREEEIQRRIRAIIGKSRAAPL